ncbi:MAG: transport system ATPase [Dehalococcoidia bacterium]|nr:transport system ATPase [Dehalococcoidia bacterium]
MEIWQQVLEGNRRALSRLITIIENREPQAEEAMKGLYPYTGRALTIGITGPPGAGKSTLVNELAKEFRRRDKKVGVVAVDPSSPFTQGAILGDRVRMQELLGDPGIFIRSMATRGTTGGLSEATADVVAVLEAFGKDVVVVETVGTGQDEVEVMRTVQTVVVVQTPGGGDSIQALKAGILEIAHIYAVNKADKDGANQAAAYLRQAMSLLPQVGWKPPIIKTVATRGEGISELVDAIEEHTKYLDSTGVGKQQELARVKHHLISLAQRELYQRLRKAQDGDGPVEEMIQAVARRELDPHTAARRLVDSVIASAEPATPQLRP